MGKGRYKDWRGPSRERECRKQDGQGRRLSKDVVLAGSTFRAITYGVLEHEIHL